jgi:hypothetical protein
MFCLSMPLAVPSPLGKKKTPGSGSKTIRGTAVLISHTFRPIVSTSLRHTPGLRIYALRVEENRPDQAVSHSPPFPPCPSRTSRTVLARLNELPGELVVPVKMPATRSETFDPLSAHE